MIFYFSIVRFISKTKKHFYEENSSPSLLVKKKPYNFKNLFCFGKKHEAMNSLRFIEGQYKFNE